jgi:hypothetical protein
VARKNPKSFDDRAFLHWKSLLDAYYNEPTITNYVRLKRATGMSAVAQEFIDFDPHAIADELRQFGIEPLLVSGALDGDGSDIEELSVRLMERLIERDGLEKRGRTQVQSWRMAISDSLVDFLIVAMLQAVLEEQHSALSVLFRERLCGQKPDFYNEHLRLMNQRKAVALAALKFPAGKISIRKVARLMKVEPSTVSRWFPAGDLQEQVEQFRRSVDAFGLIEKRAKPQKKINDNFDAPGFEAAARTSKKE